MWFQLSFASVLAMSLFLVLVVCLSMYFGLKILPLKTTQSEKNASELPLRTNMYFIRSIPVLLGLLGLCVFFIPLAPLLNHYQNTNQVILQQKLGIFLLIVLFVAGVGLLYASIKKSLSWNKGEDGHG